MKYQVVVPGRIPSEVLRALSDVCDVEYWDDADPMPPQLLEKHLARAEGLLSAGGIRVDEALLQKSPRLRVIAQPTVGFDNIDVAACTKRRIPVGNTPGVVVEATADLTYGLLLAAARRLFDGFDQVRQGQWLNATDVPYGVDLWGKTLGIVGMGDIGYAVAKRALASGMNIVYHNRKPRLDAHQVHAQYLAFEDLLKTSDFVVVLVPLTPSTHHLFGEHAFSIMKRGAYLINTARGPVVDSAALYDALKNGQLAYAAMDVTSPEPLPGDHPLLSLNNICITPHIGTATYETRREMAMLAVKNLLAGLARRALPTCVNQEVNYPL